MSSSMGDLICTDFLTWGACERSDDGEITTEAVNRALLCHNPRRCLVEPLLLTSNNRKQAAFVWQGLASFSATYGGPCAPPSTPVEAPDFVNPCTDFVLVGFAAEEDEGGIQLAEVMSALQRDGRGSKRAVTFTSNHAGCAHFVTDGLCSTPLTSKDVQWMESIAECRPGALFKSFAAAAREPASASEIPYDPMRRFTALSAAHAMRAPRGAKTVEHLENLRTSNPLTKPEGWIDWAALVAQVHSSRAAQVNTQALIDRDVAAWQRARVAAAAAASPTPAVASEKAAAYYKTKPFSPTAGAGVNGSPRSGTTSVARRLAADVPAQWALPEPTGSPSNFLKRAMHLGRLKSVDDVASSERDGRAERSSNDSVMVMLEGESPLVGKAPLSPESSKAPWAKGVATPPMDIDERGVAGLHAAVGERSPSSVVVGMAGEHLDKAFPPLPPPEAAKQTDTWGVQAVDHALYEYKVVPPGPGWYSDS